jgi:transposase
MIQLDEDTRKRLRKLQRTNRDKNIFVKVTVLLMLDQGFSPEAIANSLGIDDSTVFRYQKAFKEKGLDSYLDNRYVAYSGKLSQEQEALLAQELTGNLYISSKEIADYIRHTFSVKYTPKGVVKLLHRLGFVYKKTTAVPSKGDAEAQQKFLEAFQALMAGLSPEEVVYFNDGVHPQHNTRPDYGWIPKGQTFEMPSNPGRRRININGALNAQDVTDIVVREDDRINAQSVMKLWDTLQARNPGKTIYNICDNALYYHSRQIKNYLEANPRVKIIFLPAYSPNLNLIERLWKFLRKQVTSYYFYEHYAEFRQAILDFFQQIKNYKTELESLLTLKFRIVSPA